MWGIGFGDWVERKLKLVCLCIANASYPENERARRAEELAISKKRKEKKRKEKRAARQADGVDEDGHPLGKKDSKTPKTRKKAPPVRHIVCKKGRQAGKHVDR